MPCRLDFSLSFPHPEESPREEICNHRQRLVTSRLHSISPCSRRWNRNPCHYILFVLPLCPPITITDSVTATANTWQKQAAYHALSTLEIGNLSCIPVIFGATYPLINTYERFQAWESVHGLLPWQGVFAPYNATAEALGSDPTAGTNPNRISRGAFVQGYPNT